MKTKSLSNGKIIFLSIIAVGLVSLLALYFLNLLPFARFINLNTEEKAAAYLINKGICKEIKSITQTERKRVVNGLTEPTGELSWSFSCIPPTGLIPDAFQVHQDGTLVYYNEAL